MAGSQQCFSFPGILSPDILVFQKDSYCYKGKKRGFFIQNHLKRWFGRVSPHLCLWAPVSRVSWNNVTNLAKSVWICLGMFANLAPSWNWRNKMIASLATAQIGGEKKRTPFWVRGKGGGEGWGEVRRTTHGFKRRWRQ